MGSPSSRVPAADGRGVGKAHAQVAGELLADGELEAVSRLAIGALVQSKRGRPAIRRHNIDNPTPALNPIQISVQHLSACH